MLLLILDIITTLVKVSQKILVAIWRTVVGRDEKSVEGQRILITGAGSGLGRMMAISFAKRGAEIVAWDISKVDNEQTAKMIREAGGKARAYTVDISQASLVTKAANQVKEEIGDIDILINNAGIVTGKKFLESSQQAIVKTFEVNVLSHFWTTQCFLPSMLDRNHGHIVNISSMAGMVGMNQLVDYSASKFADVGFSESLAAEIVVTGKSDVHVTVVCPYYINTGMFSGVQIRFPSLLPIMDQGEVVKKIVSAVLTNQRLLCLPRFMYLVLVLKSLLPVDAALELNRFFGSFSQMDTFVGREKSQ